MLPTKESIITIQNECSIEFVLLLTNNFSKTQYKSTNNLSRDYDTIPLLAAVTLTVVISC